MEQLGCGERPSKRAKAMQAREDVARALMQRQTMEVLIEGILATQGRTAIDRIIDLGRCRLGLETMESLLSAEAEEAAAVEAARQAEAAARLSHNVQLTGVVHKVRLGQLRVFKANGKLGKVVGWAPDADAPLDGSGSPGSSTDPAPPTGTVDGPMGHFLVRWSTSAANQRATFSTDWSPVSVKDLYALHWNKPPASSRVAKGSNWVAPIFGSHLETSLLQERAAPSTVRDGAPLLILPVTKALRECVKLLLARRSDWMGYCDMSVTRQGQVSLWNVKVNYETGAQEASRDRLKLSFVMAPSQTYLRAPNASPVFPSRDASKLLWRSDLPQHVHYQDERSLAGSFIHFNATKPQSASGTALAAAPMVAQGKMLRFYRPEVPVLQALVLVCRKWELTTDLAQRIAGCLLYSETCELTACPNYSQRRTATALALDGPLPHPACNDLYARMPKSEPLTLELPAEVLVLLANRARFFQRGYHHSDLSVARLTIEVGRAGYLLRKRRPIEQLASEQKQITEPDDLCVRFGFELKNQEFLGHRAVVKASLMMRAKGTDAPAVTWPVSWAQQPAAKAVFHGNYAIQNSVLHVLVSDSLQKKSGARMQCYPVDIEGRARLVLETTHTHGVKVEATAPFLNGQSSVVPDADLWAPEP